MDKSKKLVYDRSKPFNDLPLLPPDLKLDNEILLKWGLASRALAALNKNIFRLPNPHMLINTLALREAKSSSEIENIFTTGDELYKAISDSVKEERANPSTKEVLRYREAMWEGFNQLLKKDSLTLSGIIAIHKQVKNTSQGIRPPQSLTVIKRGNSEFRSGEVIYTPPRGKGVLEAKMKNLLQFMHEDKLSDLDPLLKMCIAHYQFEAIHPFSDGNGRTGRIINLLYLIQTQLISHPVLYLSKYIIENKEDYYYHLANVTQKRAWKSWILFMLEGVMQTSKHTNQLIDEIINQMDSTYIHGKQQLKWYNKDINELIFTQPYCKAKTIGAAIERSSRTTLTKYMADLVSLGILTPKQDGKEVFYVNEDLVRILEG
ncbi:MAG: Fic family protein [Crocinitomicaceae bacterium]|nr:Fic family protein [Crocinitomicaceae bacterium]